jgi:hypothetical protein
MLFRFIYTNCDCTVSHRESWTLISTAYSKWQRITCIHTYIHTYIHTVTEWHRDASSNSVLPVALSSNSVLELRRLLLNTELEDPASSNSVLVSHCDSTRHLHDGRVDVFISTGARRLKTLNRWCSKEIHHDSVMYMYKKYIIMYFSQPLSGCDREELRNQHHFPSASVLPYVLLPLCQAFAELIYLA